MSNMASMHGAKNGLACGLSALIPAIIFLLYNIESTQMEYYNDLEPFLSLFPVFIFITCLISNTSINEKKEILQCSLSCALFGIVVWNFIFQMFFSAHAVLNDYESSFVIIGAGGIIEAQSMSYALLTAILSSFIRILNLQDNEESISSQNLPPKPNWDPRIENLREELAATNQAVLQIKKELWQRR